MEKTEQKYLPKVALARLHTARSLEEVKEQTKGQHFTRNEMKAMVRCNEFLDGLEVYVSKWNWDNHESWHLYNWKQQDDETMKKALYEAEQYHPFADVRYKNNFEQFEKDWEAGTYDPGMTYSFSDKECEILEVVQEEVDNIDPKEVKRAVQKAQDAKRDRQRKHRMKASKGSRYRKKYF